MQLHLYMYEVRKPGSPQQTWATFLRNHASEIWSCDFLQTYDLFFQAVFVFVIIELGSRRLLHFGVTRNPTDAWVAPQLREATPFGKGFAMDHSSTSATSAATESTRDKQRTRRMV